MNRESNLEPNSAPPARKARQKYASAKLPTFVYDDPVEETKVVRKAKRKQLTLPLTHVVVAKDETYDISKEYEFIELLGVGTYSQVQLAKNLISGSKVAVKISRGDNSLALLRNEKDILERLPHSCFPKVYEFKVDKIFKKGYLVIEYIEGLTLDKYIKEHHELCQEEAIDFLTQLCQMVKLLHECNICHRDIKPQNLIVTPDKKLKLIDFNISKVWKEKESEEKFKGSFMTQVSTPYYAAPEIYTKAGYTEAIDIWGIGIIGFMLFGGQPEINVRKHIIEDCQRPLPYSEYIQEASNMPDFVKNFLGQCLDMIYDKRCTVYDEAFNAFIAYTRDNQFL